jgi:hypothetical protein
VAQAALVEQIVPHAEPLQILGLQTCVEMAGQLPLPSQVAAFVAVPLVQLAVRQGVEALANTHAADVPLHELPQGIAPVQAGCPVRGVPVTKLQVPASALETLQNSQDPVQAVLQQTPSTHELFAHSRAATHDCPFAFFGMQFGATQKLLTQSVSAAQVTALQLVVDAQMTPPGHPIVVDGVTQVPAPSHIGIARSRPFAHAVAPQVIVVLRKRQPPLPSQVPSCPQGAVSTAHFPFDDPPDETGLHSPFAAPVSELEHEKQVPVHALSQQIPLTHAPCTHSLFAMHVEPSIFFAAQVIAGEQ